MNASSVRAIIRREYVERVRTKSFAVMTVLIPLFMAGSMLIPLLVQRREAGVQRRVAIADGTGLLIAPIRAALADTLPDGRPRYVIVATDYDTAAIAAARQLVRVHAYDALLVIPPDILERSRATYVSSGPDFMEARAVQTALAAEVTALRLRRAGLDPARIAALTQGVRTDMVILRGEGEGQSPEAVMVGTTIMAMLMYMSLVIYGAWTMRGVIRDKTMRIVEILVSTVSPTDLMVGKIVGIGAVGLTQVSIWLGAMVAVGVAAPASPVGRYLHTLSILAVPTFLLFYVTGFLLFATLYAGTGAASASEEDAAQLQWPVLVLLMVPIFLLGPAVSSPDRPLIVALSYVPFFAPVLMFLRWMAGAAGLFSVAAALVLIVAAALFFAWVSGRLFRVGILMTGKRPTVREIWRWVRET